MAETTRKTAPVSIEDRSAALLGRLLTQLEDLLDSGEGTLSVDAAHRLSQSCVSVAGEIRRQAKADQRWAVDASAADKMAALQEFIAELPTPRQRELLEWMAELLRPAARSA